MDKETVKIEVRDTGKGKRLVKIVESDIDLNVIQEKIKSSQKRIDDANLELERHVAEHDEKVALAQSEIDELQSNLDLAVAENIPVSAQVETSEVDVLPE